MTVFLFFYKLAESIARTGFCRFWIMSDTCKLYFTRSYVFSGIFYVDK